MLQPPLMVLVVMRDRLQRTEWFMLRAQDSQTHLLLVLREASLPQKRR